VTDDARIVDPGGYQIESFFKHQRNVREDEFWFLRLESADERRADPRWISPAQRRRGRASTLIAQAKTLLRPLQANDFGLAVTVGALKQNPLVSMDTPHWSPFVNLIGSRSWPMMPWSYTSMPALSTTETAAITRYTWGLGAEIAAGTRLWAILETYRPRR